jgi:transglutaminase-like putative cysteine protease
MTELARQGRKNPVIRAKAVELTARLPQKHWIAEIAALHRFVRDDVRYVRDVRDVETVHTPEAVLELRSGDCDDKSVLLAALLESIGHPARYVAVGFQPGRYSHVYVQTLVGRKPGKWLGLETTEPVALGWEPRGVVERMIRHI